MHQVMKLAALNFILAAVTLLIPAYGSAQGFHRLHINVRMCAKIAKQLKQEKAMMRKSAAHRIKARKLSRQNDLLCDAEPVCGLLSTNYSEGTVGIPYAALKTFGNKALMEQAGASIIGYGECPSEEQYQ